MPRAAKLGYAVAADEWGRGYGADAARTLLTYGFEHLDLHRVSAAVGPGNGSSIRLLERLGFAREGRLRDHVFTNGAWRDSPAALRARARVVPHDPPRVGRRRPSLTQLAEYGPCCTHSVA